MYFMLQEDLVENVVQDPLYKCEEKQEENCHITFVTTFKSHSEEDCAEHFEKKCQIRKGLNLIFKADLTLVASVVLKYEKKSLCHFISNQDSTLSSASNRKLRWRKSSTVMSEYYVCKICTTCTTDYTLVSVSDIFARLVNGWISVL